MAGPERYAFGDLELDVTERRLSRSGRHVTVAPKAYDVLVHLVRNAGRLVTKRELLDQIWTESFVEEGILSVHVSGLRKTLGDDDRSPRYIETVARSGYRFIATVTSPDRDQPGAPMRTAIAVLPAQPADGEASEATRAVGLALAAAVIDRLGRFEQIAVRPVRAVHTRPVAETDPVAIGRALHVDAVVVARFEKAAERMRVAARLLRTQDGAPLWSGEYDEFPSSEASIPDAIAESIAASLDARAVTRRTAGVFGNWADARRQPRAPAHPEIYELVGRGRSHLLAFSMSDVPKAIAAFEAAIERDPAFAGAPAGLALAFCQQAELRLAPPAEAYARAKTAALRALALDEACADAQVALGAISFLGHWDWIGAERSLQRALELNPNHTEAYVLYGRLLDALGRLDEGLEMKQRALDRDPFSPFVHLAISMSYWHQRRFEDSIAWANKTLALDPRHLIAREHLAGAYWAMGDFDRHMAENIKHAEAYGVPADALAPMKEAYAAGGRPEVIRRLLAAHATSLPAMQLALLHGELGDLDTAIAQLERAIDTHEPCLVDLAVGPQWDHLRGDARFRQCLARMGLAAG
ncbi:MAG: winged helix-turn-helix domain-containing tetratricopeptide repeat protein [Vicinamibacterales bacterium]